MLDIVLVNHQPIVPLIGQLPNVSFICQLISMLRFEPMFLKGLIHNMGN